MEQLILHLVGDYVTQSDWMAQNKTKAFWPAFLHALVYSFPFLMIGSGVAVGVILFTHFAIDRYRLARFVVFVKEFVLSPNIVYPSRNPDPLDWDDCKVTGYPSAKPAWLAVWLLIAADNTIHLAINYASIRWL